jgi:hypothetical protein
MSTDQELPTQEECSALEEKVSKVTNLLKELELEYVLAVVDGEDNVKVSAEASSALLAQCIEIIAKECPSALQMYLVRGLM